MNLFDKLSLRSSNYVAVINGDIKTINDVALSVRGVVCAGKEKVRGLRHVSDSSKLDASAFDRIFYRWGTPKKNPLPDCIKACENLGLVLMSNVPLSSKKGLTSYLERQGIYEWWFAQEGYKNGDFLFKVRKYPEIKGVNFQ